MRDRAALLYFDTVDPGSGTGPSILARATAAGTFRWPATQVTPMYDTVSRPVAFKRMRHLRRIILANPRFPRVLVAGVLVVVVVGIVFAWWLPVPYQTAKVPRRNVNAIGLSWPRNCRFSPSQQARTQFPVALEQMGPWLPRFTVALEDRRFYEHSGIDCARPCRQPHAISDRDTSFRAHRPSHSSL